MARNGKPLATWVVKGLLPFVPWALGFLGVPTGLSAFSGSCRWGAFPRQWGPLRRELTAFSWEALAGLHVEQSIPCVGSEGQEGAT